MTENPDINEIKRKCRQAISNIDFSKEVLKFYQDRCPHYNLSNDWRHGDEFIVDCLDCCKEKINIK